MNPTDDIPECHWRLSAKRLCGLETTCGETGLPQCFWKAKKPVAPQLSATGSFRDVRNMNRRHLTLCLAWRKFLNITPSQLFTLLSYLTGSVTTPKGATRKVRIPCSARGCSFKTCTHRFLSYLASTALVRSREGTRVVDRTCVGSCKLHLFWFLWLLQILYIYLKKKNNPGPSRWLMGTRKPLPSLRSSSSQDIRGEWETLSSNLHSIQATVCTYAPPIHTSFWCKEANRKRESSKGKYH